MSDDLSEWRNRLGDRRGIAAVISRGNPAWLAAMAAAGFKPRLSNRVRCHSMVRGTDRQCGHPALAGQRTCRIHAPLAYVRATRCPARDALRARPPAAPPELRALPVWRACTGQREVRRALVHAWLARESDPAAWRNAVRQALEVVHGA